MPLLFGFNSGINVKIQWILTSYLVNSKKNKEEPSVLFILSFFFGSWGLFLHRHMSNLIKQITVYNQCTSSTANKTQED